MAAPLKSIPTWFGSHLPSWCVILLVMHSLHSAIAGVPAMEEWYFLPNFGKDIRGIERMESALGFLSRLSEVANALLAPDGGLTDQERKLVKWHPATFPHQDFVGMMPGRKVFGWYACVFDVPENKANQDLLVDLGLIDDADECYLNGQRIGGMGRVPGGSAWQSDRLYRVPAEKVRQTGNYLAVHVWSLWGLGGIVGPPILKLALASAESQWEIAMVKDTALPVNGLNGALTAEVACELCLPGQAPQWRKANLPWKNYSNWKDDEHLAMFWLGFPMFQNDGTPFCPTMPVALDLGPIFDVAAVFLNNQRIGLIGRFEKQEEPMFSEAACRACLQVPPEIWSRDGHNQLMIVVQRSRGIGGLPGVPGLCLTNPVENSSVARCREAFDSLVCSNRLEEAGDLLETHFGLAQADPVWFLSSRAYLSYLAWTDGGRADSSQPERLLADIAEILREHPSRSPRQSAMQAFCRVLRLAEDDDALLALVRRHFPHAMENSLALALDWENQGDWIPYRGYDMFILSSMGQVGDWYGGFLPFPYSRGIPGKRDTPRHWLDAAARRVHDASALLMPDKYRDAMFGEGEFSAKVPSGTGHFLPGQKVRRAAWWDDHGEMHPFDDDGPDLEAHIRETTEKNASCRCI